jgi:hypothetical protein
LRRQVVAAATQLDAAVHSCIEEYGGVGRLVDHGSDFLLRDGADPSDSVSFVLNGMLYGAPGSCRWLTDYD